MTRTDFFIRGALLLFLFVSGNLVAADPVATPKRFSAAIGGFLGESFTVEMTSPDTLSYAHNLHTLTGGPGTERTTVKVTEAQWKQFRVRLDAAKVWTWQADYVNKGVVDGTIWNFTVDFGDKKVETRGRNAYPDRTQFEAMLAAVQGLLGGRGFK